MGYVSKTMKTTLEISDHLLARAKLLAGKRKTTLRSLAEEGLQRVLEAEDTQSQVHRIRPVTVAGKGLAPEFQAAAWKQIRDAAYAER